MKVTVNLSSILNNISELTLDINTYRDIVSALVNLMPDIRNRQIVLVDGDSIIYKDKLEFSPKTDTIHVVPLIAGGLSSSFDSLGNLTMFYGSGTVIGNQELALTGLDRRIIESSLYGKAQTAFDIAQRASDRESGITEGTDDPTTGFGTLTITSVKGQHIPLHFGLVRTSGALINQNVRHIQRGNVDNVKVSQYI
jgi:predicted phage tail protein